MASNSFFTGGGSSDQNRNQQTTGSCRPRKKSSSKSSAEINKKKTPGRGMGVEKLERLSELERLSKLERLSNNNNNINNNNNNKTASFSLSSLPYAFIPTGFVADPSGIGNGTISPLPMIPFSKYGAGMGAGNGGGGGCLSLIPSHPFMGITGATGVRAFNPNNGQGLQDISVDHLKGNSRELPSIPNLMQYCDFCPDCSKKKRPVRYACNKMVFDGVNPSFQEGAKVVALHRAKESTMGRENQVVMEYDFFPEGRKPTAAAGKSKINEEDELMMMVGGGSSRGAVVQGGGGGGTNGDAGGGGGGEAAASCLTTTTGTGGAAADDASTYIDLSLKLSY